jgi:hypothetical protein
MRIVHALAARHPGVSYDVTIKIEHLLEHRDRLRSLVETGCAFVTSAVESIDDRVLELLAKGHTRGDVEETVTLCRAAGLPLRPTFVAFTPWTSLEGYCELLRAIRDLDLVDGVAPIQLAIRLLIPAGSRLLELPDVRALAGAFDPVRLVHPWTHEDPRVDRLQQDVAGLVPALAGAPPGEAFDAVATLAHERAGLPWVRRPAPRPRSSVPYLDEPWYC